MKFQAGTTSKGHFASQTVYRILLKLDGIDHRQITDVNTRNLFFAVASLYLGHCGSKTRKEMLYEMFDESRIS